MLKELAYAKINLNLYVGLKREDGYHPIHSIMQTISLYDELYLDVLSGDTITLEIECSQDLANDESNLVIKAAKAFLKETNIQSSLSFKLKKNIPIGAGLGGGSSDCAATLRLLNRAFDYPLSLDKLLSIAASLGSDIPFLMQGGIQLCTGRGEFLKTLEMKWDKFILLCTSNEYVSTKDAYKKLDSILENNFVSFPDDNYLTFESIHFYNSFEQAILDDIPKANTALNTMKKYNALYSLMSGSGSSVYGIFNTEEDAKNAQKQIKTQSYILRPIF